MPNLDFGAIRTDIFDEHRGVLFRYFKIIYHQLLIFSMVDIGARTKGEILFTIVLIIESAIVNAIIYG